MDSFLKGIFGYGSSDPVRPVEKQASGTPHTESIKTLLTETLGEGSSFFQDRLNHALDNPTTGEALSTLASAVKLYRAHEASWSVVESADKQFRQVIEGAEEKSFLGQIGDRLLQKINLPENEAFKAKEGELKELLDEVYDLQVQIDQLKYREQAALIDTFPFEQMKEALLASGLDQEVADFVNMIQPPVVDPSKLPRVQLRTALLKKLLQLGVDAAALKQCEGADPQVLKLLENAYESLNDFKSQLAGVVDADDIVAIDTGSFLKCANAFKDQQGYESMADALILALFNMTQKNEMPTQYRSVKSYDINESLGVRGDENFDKMEKITIDGTTHSVPKGFVADFHRASYTVNGRQFKGKSAKVHKGIETFYSRFLNDGITPEDLQTLVGYAFQRTPLSFLKDQPLYTTCCQVWFGGEGPERKVEYRFSIHNKEVQLTYVSGDSRKVGNELELGHEIRISFDFKQPEGGSSDYKNGEVLVSLIPFCRSRRKSETAKVKGLIAETLGEGSVALEKQFDRALENRLTREALLSLTESLRQYRAGKSNWLSVRRADARFREAIKGNVEQPFLSRLGDLLVSNPRSIRNEVADVLKKAAASVEEKDFQFIEHDESYALPYSTHAEVHSPETDDEETKVSVLFQLKGGASSALELVLPSKNTLPASLKELETGQFLSAFGMQLAEPNKKIVSSDLTEKQKADIQLLVSHMAAPFDEALSTLIQMGITGESSSRPTTFSLAEQIHMSAVREGEELLGEMRALHPEMDSLDPRIFTALEKGNIELNSKVGAYLKSLRSAALHVNERVRNDQPIDFEQDVFTSLVKQSQDLIEFLALQDKNDPIKEVEKLNNTLIFSRKLSPPAKIEDLEKLVEEKNAFKVRKRELEEIVEEVRRFQAEVDRLQYREQADLIDSSRFECLKESLLVKCDDPEVRDFVEAIRLPSIDVFTLPSAQFEEGILQDLLDLGVDPAALRLCEKADEGVMELLADAKAALIRFQEGLSELTDLMDADSVNVQGIYDVMNEFEAREGFRPMADALVLALFRITQKKAFKGSRDMNPSAINNEYEKRQGNDFKVAYKIPLGEELCSVLEGFRKDFPRSDYVVNGHIYRGKNPAHMEASQKDVKDFFSLFIKEGVAPEDLEALTGYAFQRTATCMPMKAQVFWTVPMFWFNGNVTDVVNEYRFTVENGNVQFSYVLRKVLKIEAGMEFGSDNRVDFLFRQKSDGSFNYKEGAIMTSFIPFCRPQQEEKKLSEDAQD